MEKSPQRPNTGLVKVQKTVSAGSGQGPGQSALSRSRVGVEVIKSEARARKAQGPPHWWLASSRPDIGTIRRMVQSGEENPSFADWKEAQKVGLKVSVIDRQL
jgi:hypothetical protein